MPRPSSLRLTCASHPSETLRITFAVCIRALTPKHSHAALRAKNQDDEPKGTDNSNGNIDTTDTNGMRGDASSSSTALFLYGFKATRTDAQSRYAVAQSRHVVTLSHRGQS